MIAWLPFTYRGQTHDLSHLHPRVITFRQPAKGDAAERYYEVQVIFGLHCFTHGAGPDEDSHGELSYGDDRERRIFDFRRHELSKRLPELVEQLDRRPCFHTDRGNFFTVEAIDAESGATESYEVYFTASKSGTVRGRLNLFVQSAYVRDRFHPNRPKPNRIGLFVVLHNTLTGKPIKAPPK